MGDGVADSDCGRNVGDDGGGDERGSERSRRGFGAKGGAVES